MRGLVALLCVVGTAHALGETCSTLWSKLAHLGCRPQDQPLRDDLDTLTLADGGVVTLRCTADHEFCFRADPATKISQPLETFLTPEPFAGFARSTTTTTTPATLAAPARTRADDALIPPSALAAVIVGDSFTAPARRRLLSSPTAEPSPAPTFLPSPVPSVSPVPTTAEITTWSQLRNAVADPAVSTINVSVDIAFPAQIEVTPSMLQT